MSVAVQNTNNVSNEVRIGGNVGWRSKEVSFAQMKTLRYMVWNYKINVTIPKTRGEVSDLITLIEGKIRYGTVKPRLNKDTGKVLREENLLHFITIEKVVEKKYTYVCHDCGQVYKTDTRTFFKKDRHCGTCDVHAEQDAHCDEMDRRANEECR